MRVAAALAALTLLCKYHLIAPGAWVICEMATGDRLPSLPPSLSLWRSVSYGKNCMNILTMKSPSAQEVEP